jgi:glycosyltransferase involved in cell wall biosynthesis
MKLLLLGPLPEPTTGHSLAFKVLRDGLSTKHSVETINLSQSKMVRKGGALKTALRTLGRAARIAIMMPRKDIIYLTVAESVPGNLKDLLFYTTCLPRLANVVIHLHGGSIRHDVLDRHPLLARLNGFFLRRIGGAVILGESHRHVFNGYIAPEKVWIVPNYADPAMLIDEASIDTKFGMPLRLLYLSNFIAAKGYQDLIDAYALLAPALQAGIRIDFAGAFDDVADERAFQATIARYPNLRFHGTVSGDDKRRLLHESDVLCLPTKFREGQPLSILEAFAAGCAVLTTPMGGIPDIVRAEENGILIAAGDVSALSRAIARLPEQRDALRAMARTNRERALREFGIERYVDSVNAVFQQVASTSRIPSG